MNKKTIIKLIKGFVHHNEMVNALNDMRNTACNDCPDYEPILELMGLEIENMTGEQQSLVHHIFCTAYPWKKDSSDIAEDIYNSLLAVKQLLEKPLQAVA